MIKVKVMELKTAHPDWGYKRIAKEVGCSPNTVKFHLSDKAKEDGRRRSRKAKFAKKLGRFRHRLRERKKNFDRVEGSDRKSKAAKTFSPKQLLKHIGDNPVCYLTGESIDLKKYDTYEFDHIIPVSKGGKNTLRNFGLAAKGVNQAKGNLSVKDFVAMCRKVVAHADAGLVLMGCPTDSATVPSGSQPEMLTSTPRTHLEPAVGYAPTVAELQIPPHPR